MECSEMFEIGAGENGGGALSTSHHHTSWGSNARAQEADPGDRGCRAGWGPHPEDPDESVSALPTLSSEQGRGVGLPGWGCLSFTLTPKNKKLRKDGRPSYSKRFIFVKGEVT